MERRALHSQITASESSLGREIDGVSGEVEFRRACPSANLGLSIAANTSEARLSTLEDTRIDEWVGLPSSSDLINNNGSAAGQHRQVGANPMAFLRYGPW